MSSMTRSWTEIGAAAVDRHGGRTRLAASIDALVWQPATNPLPAYHGLAIQQAQEWFGLPALTTVAVSHTVAPMVLVGLKWIGNDGHHDRLIALDHGATLTPVALDRIRGERLTPPRDGWV